MKLKKLSLIILSSVLAVCMGLSLFGCKENVDDNNEDDGGTNQPDVTEPVQLIAPVISLDESVITWGAVENANYYEVYENSTRVARVTATTYTIEQYEEGSYLYNVKAFSVSASYVASGLSNTVEYVVEGAGSQQQILAAPQLSLDDSTLTWTAVDNADGYSVYVDNVLLGTTTETTYKLNEYMPATYTYTVRATSTNPLFVISPASNAVKRTVTAKKMTYTVTVNMPITLSDSDIDIGLFIGTTRVSSQTVGSVPVGYGVYRFMISATLSGEVTAMVIGLPEGYTASQTTLDPNNRNAEITIYTVSKGSLVLGNNSVRVDILDDEGADREYDFVAEKGGVYTVSTTEAAGLVISVNGILAIDATQQFRQSTFTAEAGEKVTFIIVCEMMNVNFTFSITEGAQKRYFDIGSGYGNTPNMFVGAGTYYLNVETAGVYTFMFGPTLGNLGVTFKIGGKDYYFGWYGVEDAPDDAQLNIIDIQLAAGEVEIEITISENYMDDLLGFFIFPAA